MKLAVLLLSGALASVPPGPGPFTQEVMRQPVPGAARAATADGWRQGKLCDVSKAPYSAKNGTNATDILRRAIQDCGDLADGGTVLIPSGLTLQTASLWLKSNLTLRVEEGATLLGSELIDDAPLEYVRRNALLVVGHAGFLNGGRCLDLAKDPQGRLSDCRKWSRLENVVVEGGGTLDANGDFWYNGTAVKDDNTRPMMLDFMWVDGLTIRDMKIRRPGYWTVHPTFSNNVRVENNDIYTYGHNTDGCDPDSTWNVYIARNNFSTGDDCIAIKSGRDWSGLQTNLSTVNVLAEQNIFYQGHGVSIGSETSGWIRNITIRDSICHGTNKAVRLKSSRGRGGGIEDVLYQNLTGSVEQAVELTLNYEKHDPTNVTATPTIRNIIVRDVVVEATKGKAVTCDGLDDSQIEGIRFENVQVSGEKLSSECSQCSISVDEVSSDVVPATCRASSTIVV